jgi:Zn-dependent protease
MLNVGIMFARANIGLALFNLIPIFPMAMSKIIHLFISPEASMRLNIYEKPLQIFLFIFLLFGLVQSLIFPIRNFIIGAVWL